MGVYKFRWNRPAQTVVVTGTFDDWSGSESLDRVGDGFEKAVRIEDAADKVYYKFVVDDAWTTDPSAPQETDSHGNQNNVLSQDDIMADDKATTPADAAAALQNNVTPDSSTAQLAGAQPTTASSKKKNKKKKKAKAAGAAAEEPAEEKAEDKPAEAAQAADEVSATPAPAEASEAEKKPEPVAKSEEQPEEKPEAKPQETPEKPAAKDAAATPTGVPGGFPNTPALVAEQEREASVSPLPAANGAVNPVKLEPGEEVPKATTDDVNKNVKLDKESYEKSDALPAEDLNDKPVSVDPLPAAEGAVNPVKLEPGQEVPKATTEDVNKNVKLDKESYEKADALPQSGSLPPADKQTIPESSLPVTGAAEAALLNSAGPESTTAKLAGQVPLEPKAEKPAAAVPEPVKGSIAESGEAPEAAASGEKVEEKKRVEEEVKKNVETKPAEPAKKEEPKPAETKAAEPAKKEEAPKPAEPKKEEAAKPAEGAATNGAKADEPAKKKKNRLSSIFTKLKSKFSE